MAGFGGAAAGGWEFGHVFFLNLPDLEMRGYLKRKEGFTNKMILFNQQLSTT